MFLEVATACDAGEEGGGSKHAFIAAFRCFLPQSSNRPKCARNFRDSLQSIWAGQWVNTAERSLQTSLTVFSKKELSSHRDSL